MRLLLSIVAGGQGKTVVLSHSLEAVVGRSPEADLCVKGDQKISGRHFRVFPKGGGWHLEDLHSSNGTLVNNQRMANCCLQDGDLITAGETKFKVNIEGGDRSSAIAIRSSWEIDGEDSAVAQARRGKLHIPFTAEETPTGIHVCQGDFEKIEPARLVKVLRGSRKFIPFLIVDFRRLGLEPPPALAADCLPIVNWVGGPEASRAFPMLIPLEERPPDQWEALVNEGWDQDAVMITFSRKSADDVLAHWRSFAKGAQGGLVGVVWPSVLCSMIPHNAVGKKLMDGLDGVLTELPDLPGQWRLWTRKQRISILKEFGFQHQIAPEEALDTRKD